jgi:FkbM family methyltransferase
MYRAIEILARRNMMFRSFLYNFLIRNYDGNAFKKLHQRAWKRVILKNVDKPVTTKVHGYNAVVNSGFGYPLVARSHQQFNNPLIQLVHQTWRAKGKPITLIDIGAAVGDTVFLLNANLPNAFQRILCIDGDNEFFGYLQKNMQQFPFVECVHSLLSEKKQMEKSLVRIHAGTASSQGTTEVQSVTLDELIEQRKLESVDVLKIDTDGFDGKVLSGSINILKDHKPSIIFEWHPILINKTGNSISEAFNVLIDCGYTNFTFFTKFGGFSHFMCGLNLHELELLSQLSSNNKHISDWHYDVVATNDSIDIVALAECSFAKQKLSAY